MSKRLLPALILVLLTAVQAAAQSWDAPSFFASRPADELGVYVSTSGDVVGLAIWRDPARPLTLRG